MYVFINLVTLATYLRRDFRKRNKLSCELKELCSQDKPSIVSSNCNDVNATVVESLSDTEYTFDIDENILSKI